MEIEYWQNVALMTLLSLKVATLACALIFVPGVAAGYFFSRARFPGRSFLEAVLLLPLVVPPVAVGLVLLYLLSTDGFIGGPLYNWFNANILLTWWAAACASAVVAFPLLFKGVQQAFREVPEDYIALATTLGKTRWQIFWQVSLPLAKAGIFQAMLLAFARALGEFGATTLVAGNIPQKTETLALGIYDSILAGHDNDAWILSGISAFLGLAALLFARALERRKLVTRESVL